MNDGAKWVIAVHCGAGVYSTQNVNKFKELMKHACKEAAQRLMSERNGALHAVCESITVLEDDEMTNAGRGSNLNEAGIVECDACISVYERNFEATKMSKAMYGSVGAVNGVQNPIQLAKEILLDCKKSMGVLGRVKPLMLCGKGAYNYARTSPNCRHLKIEPDQMKVDKYLIVERSLRSFYDYSTRVKNFEKTQNAKRKEQMEQEQLFFDTVGAICCDLDGNLSAGVSSGGVALKYAGRVGEAAIYGSGCYVTESFACSCTGVGEDIMLNQMGVQCSMLLKHDIEPDIVSSIKRVFSTDENGLIPNHNSRNVGMIALHRTTSSKNQDRLELCWAYTTKAMGVAYISSVMKEPVAFVSFHQNHDPAMNNVQIASIGI